ncbi:aminotransferase class III-fold pyridoxal phosphate-dependent enzyme [Salipiger mangrovisoli]|uniref:Aminotransferase class III-fold pyridoxal phosphate-dependent enzyme n=1 Tax=Salipiger mangrovisoli TaxID=2865933 RepID=A0ABR9X5F4_9RHOB|nr:aminotransferase class III-fold pyridoxal phosphate-dependent enzyme [Salipiger mangrovisoli]MBE9638830.1 aminotransferase class III-fold pyridoxal phosphate-dependent enzyme [Salipiger mangrovisoli]
MTTALDDLTAYWMPFTANDRFKAAPRMFTSAKGMFYTTDEGRELLDGTAGLWCCNIGHGRRRVADAVHAQMMTLDYASSFQTGHPAAFRLANRLADMAPEGLDHVFFSGSGSEAVDTALKMAIAWHKKTGQGSRTRLIGRERGFHGVGFGGVSVGGIVNNRRNYGPLLPGTDHICHTHLVQNAFSRGQPEHGAELADDLERLVALHGAETIAAVIVEPVAGATGVLVPPKGYLERLRAICDAHGILLIFDEVVTGFGRLGTNFAAQWFGVTPDIMCVAKGITGGLFPMGATLVSDKVRQAFRGDAVHGIDLFHGYTYSGHPTGVAAAEAVLDIMDQEGLVARAAAMAPLWEDALHALRDCPNVVDIRNIGLTGAVELAPREGKPGERGFDAHLHAFANGALIRAVGDIMVMSPPLIISEEQVAQLMSTLRAAIEAVA